MRFPGFPGYRGGFPPFECASPADAAQWFLGLPGNEGEVLPAERAVSVDAARWITGLGA